VPLAPSWTYAQCVNYYANCVIPQEADLGDLADERLLVSLTSAFGLLALVLASVGIYGVMAYSVAQRTKEIGIRMALGAIPRQILAMVLREAASLSAAATALGLGASLLVTRFVKASRTRHRCRAPGTGSRRVVRT
jgi:ABC-type antimicrobial peptide transport system permease subunit